jgi:polysaccharide pyruvyl transferase WcaK-like protein
LFVSIGAGPIVNRLNRLLMTSAARIADYRSYRDTVSKDFMVRIGFDAHDDPIYPDLVFSLPAPQPEENGELESGPLTVGVGVMTYYGWKSDPADGAATYQTYLRKLGEFVEWLLDQKYRVRLLVGEVTDQRAVDDLRARLASSLKDSAPSRIVSEPISSIQDLLRQVARTDLVVATRFHNVVCALMLEKPVVSLGYAEKNDVLMNEIGLAGYCQHIERFNVDRLIAQFRELVQDRQRFRQCIRSKNEQYRENLRRQFAHIVSQMA